VLRFCSVYVYALSSLTFVHLSVSLNPVFHWFWALFFPFNSSPSLSLLCFLTHHCKPSWAMTTICLKRCFVILFSIDYIFCEW
jgi:hypothetical protein